MRHPLSSLVSRLLPHTRIASCCQEADAHPGTIVAIPRRHTEERKVDRVIDRSIKRASRLERIKTVLPQSLTVTDACIPRASLRLTSGEREDTDRVPLLLLPLCLCPVLPAFALLSLSLSHERDSGGRTSEQVSEGNKSRGERASASSLIPSLSLSPSLPLPSSAVILRKHCHHLSIRINNINKGKAGDRRRTQTHSYTKTGRQRLPSRCCLIIPATASSRSVNPAVVWTACLLT